MALPALIRSHRITTYGVLSTLLVSAVIMNAFRKQTNFYSAAVYLSRSSGSTLILSNFGILVFLFLGRAFQQVYFGNLRPSEIEALYDRLWFFVTESLFAFTIFRDDFDASFVLMFMVLLFLKCFHWILADRIEMMDQVPFPGPDLLFHIRVNALFLTLWSADFIMFAFAVDSLMYSGMGYMVLFCSEFCILSVSLFNSAFKYWLGLYDLRRQRARGENAGRWQNKTMYIFYIELVTDFFKLTTYIAFFVIVMTHYGFPLNVVRDVYVTARAFVGRIRDLIRYRSATKNMEERYPNATTAELEAMSDKTCIICREEMVASSTTGSLVTEHTEQPPPTNAEATSLAPTPVQPLVATAAAVSSDAAGDVPKRLPCGHVFHFHCLRSWLERQQSCPTCRRSVLETNGQATPAGEGNRAGAGAVAPNGARDAANVIANANAFLDRLGLGNPARAGGGGGARAAQAAPQNPAGGVPAAAPPPVRQFQGFNVGGVWQPWAVGPEEADQMAALYDLATAPTTPPSPTLGSTSPTSVPAPTPTVSGSTATSPTPIALTPEAPGTSGLNATEQSSPSELSVPPDRRTPTPTTTEQNDSPANPREAAVAAALRRFGERLKGSPSTTAGSGGPGDNTQTSTSPTTQAPAPNTVAQDIQQIPAATSTIPLAQSPTSTSSSTHGSFSSPKQGRALPSLIPLFDPAAIPRTAQPFPFSPSTFASSAASTMANGNPSLSPFGNPFPSFSLPSAPSVAPSSASLPPSLSSEQLAKMDKLTREAIDERLKVLDGVQASLWRSVEDLTRMRSVLPDGPTTTSLLNDLRPDLDTRSVSENGKGKEREP